MVSKRQFHMEPHLVFDVFLESDYGAGLQYMFFFLRSKGYMCLNGLLWGLPNPPNVFMHFVYAYY